MEYSAFNRLAGKAGILSAVLYIISIVGLQKYISVSLDDVSAFTLNIVESHAMMLLYGWPGVFATLLIFPLVYTFYKMNTSSHEVSKIVLLITIVGLVFILTAYLFHLALTYFHAPIYQTLDPSQQSTFAAVFKSTVGLQDMFWLFGDLFSFGGIAWLLIMNLKEDLVPKWMLYVGIVSGILAACGSFSFIPAFKHTPGLSFLFIGGFSIFSLWEIIVGIYLIRQHSES